MKKKILVCPSDKAGVGYHRSVGPHVYFEKLYGSEFEIVIDYEPKYNDREYLKQFSLIHYHRNLGPFETMEQTLNLLDELGVKSIMDIDDYWSPGDHHPIHLIFKANKLDEKILNNIKLARNISTTTEEFAKLISKFKRKDCKILVVPNGINPEDSQFINKPTKSDRIRIGWLGSSSHEHDLAVLKGVVSQFKNDNLLDKVQFVLCGFDIRGFKTLINPQTNEQRQIKITPEESVWSRYEKIFTDNYSIVSDDYKNYLLTYNQFKDYENVENEPYRRVWTKSYKKYATNYNLFDIALAPLAINQFNIVKSQLKVVEAGFMKKAFVGSEISPYILDIKNAYAKGGIFDENANGIIVEESKAHKDWYRNLKRLVTNPEQIKILSENLYNTVKDKYSMETLSKTRYDFYTKLISE